MLDVEALRDHLGLDRVDLFGHSASGGICLLYAAAHPERLDHLVLVAPSLRVVAIPSDLGVDEVLALRADEPWYADAVAAWLAALVAPVLLVAGEYDIWPTCTAVRRLAALFGDAELAVLPRIGHFPWVDDPGSFVATVHEFLARRPAPAGDTA